MSCSQGEMCNTIIHSKLRSQDGKTEVYEITSKKFTCIKWIDVNNAVRTLSTLAEKDPYDQN